MRASTLRSFPLASGLSAHILPVRFHSFPPAAEMKQVCDLKIPFESGFTLVALVGLFAVPEPVSSSAV